MKRKQIACKDCGFVYESHPDVLDEKKLAGRCIKCFHAWEKKHGIQKA
jgi:predicted Zn-ribbon and HTH transcriptional regulator